MWIYMFKELIHTVNVETEHNTSFHQKYTTSLKCMPLPDPLCCTPHYACIWTLELSGLFLPTAAHLLCRTGGWGSKSYWLWWIFWTLLLRHAKIEGQRRQWTQRDRDPLVEQKVVLVRKSVVVLDGCKYTSQRQRPALLRSSWWPGCLSGTLMSLRVRQAPLGDHLCWCSWTPE